MLTKMRVRTPDKPHRVAQDSLPEFDEEGTYIATAKYDGYRAILDYDGRSLALFSRRGMDEGGPRKHPVGDDLMGQLSSWVNENGLAPNTRIDGEWLRYRTKGEPIYVVFGIMFAEGRWLGREPESVRWSIVKDLQYNQPNIMLAEHAEENYTEFFNRLKDRDYTRTEDDWKLEGIVLKHVTSRLVGRNKSSDKNPLWFKAKWRDGSSGKVATY